MEVRPKRLVWSQMQSGLWNGKVGIRTMFTLGQDGHNAHWILASQLPGGRKGLQVVSEAAGKLLAKQIYAEFLRSLYE